MNSYLRMFRVAVGVIGLVGCVFLLASLGSFDPLDRPSPKGVIGAGEVRNLCGPVGAYVAYHLLYYLGSGAWTMTLFAVGAFVWYMAARRIGEPYLRIVGVGLLVAVTATATAMLWPAGPDALPEGNGGVLGIAAADYLVSRMSEVGAALALVGAAAVGLVLSADSLLVLLPRLIGRAIHRGTPVLATAAGAAGKAVVGLPRLIASASPAKTVPVKPVRPSRDEKASAAALAEPDDEPDDPPPVEDEADDEPEPSADEPPSQDESPIKKGPSLSKVRELVIRSARPQDRPAKPVSPRPPELLGDYTLPPLTLLKDPTGNYAAEQEEVVRAKAVELEKTLAEFGVEAAVVQIDTGPVITMFEVDLAAGTKVSAIVNLQNDIARALAAQSVRIVAPIPGKRTVGIEVPNVDKEQVRIKELIELAAPRAAKMNLPVFLGKDASGEPLVADLSGMPHMLIAGTTGSGKSVCINTMITSLLLTQRPDHCKLILVDPKAVEMVAFQDLPHLMCPIVTDMHKAAAILEWAVTKMNERYELLSEAGAKNIASFNRLSPDEIYRRLHAETDEEKAAIPLRMPYMVIIIDELADLMMTAAKEVEHWIIRLAQKSRAIGIHLVLATQSPRVNVVTGLIKANMPCRASFRVSSKQESRIVLDQNGSETLLGEGDMLFLKPGTSKLIRAQGTWVDDEEITGLVGHLRSIAKPQFSEELIKLKPANAPDLGEPGDRDEMFDQAVEIVLQNQRGSVSLLQRKLGIGYGRAARLIDQMAEAGIVGDYAGANAREVQMTLEDWHTLKRQIASDQSDGME